MFTKVNSLRTSNKRALFMAWECKHANGNAYRALHSQTLLNFTCTPWTHTVKTLSVCEYVCECMQLSARWLVQDTLLRWAHLFIQVRRGSRTASKTTEAQLSMLRVASCDTTCHGRSRWISLLLHWGYSLSYYFHTVQQASPIRTLTP